MPAAELEVFAELSEAEFAKNYPPNFVLKQVQFIHRHGIRTPLFNLARYTGGGTANPYYWNICGLASQAIHNPAGLFPSSLPQAFHVVVAHESDRKHGNPPRCSKSPSLTACYAGQLTDHGRALMFKIGESFRKLYVDKLKLVSTQQQQPFNPDQIYLRSTNFPRTIESLQCLVQGIFHPKPTAADTMPIHILDEHTDDLYDVYICKKYVNLFNEFQRKIRGEIEQDSAAFFKNHHRGDALRGSIGNGDGTVPPAAPSDDADANLASSYYSLFDELCCRVGNKLPLPSPYTMESLKGLESIAVKQWLNIYSVDPAAARFGIGLAIGAFGRNLADATKHPDQTPRLIIYSSHDSTIGRILGAFGCFDHKWPPFGANIAIELLQDGDTDENYVRLKYNNRSLSIPRCAKDHFPTDPSLCKLDVFMEICKSICPEDFHGECQVVS